MAASNANPQEAAAAVTLLRRIRFSSILCTNCVFWSANALINSDEAFI